MQVWSLGGEDPWRRAWQSTPVSLPWRIPGTEEPGRLQSIGLQRVQHDLTIHFLLFKSQGDLIHISLVKGNLPRLLPLQSVADVTNVYAHEVCPSFLDTWKTTLSSPCAAGQGHITVLANEVWLEVMCITSEPRHRRTLDDHSSNSGAMVEVTYFKRYSYKMVWGRGPLSAWSPEFHCASRDTPSADLDWAYSVGHQ